MPKLWDKGYKVNREVEDFTVGNDFILDKKLVKYDCIASIAHARMLAKIGILKQDELDKIASELNKIINLDKQNEFVIKKEHEDCHTAIENYLTDKLGDLGKKIHTARSRNDQVLTALRLFCKDELDTIRKLILQFSQSLKNFQKKFGGVKFPGYTHTRKAMPSSISLWSQAFIDSMADNLKLLEIAYDLIDQNPLGTGAGYGVPIAIDRKITTKLLKFDRVQENPIYAQLSRGKFESTILHSLTQIMLDLNRVSTDLILFSMQEFGYFELPKEFCTGSSMMPQKKNPDVLELVRAKYHIMLGYESQVKSMTSNLISGYHRDLQLTKEPLMRGFETTKECLAIMSAVFDGLRVNPEKCKKAMTEELFATEKAYELVKKGISFREAYKKVGEEFR